MLAVVLVPLVVMTIACLLERLEARTVPGEGTRTARRATASPAPAAAPSGRHLRLLPALAEVTGPARPAAGDALRRAS